MKKQIGYIGLGKMGRNMVHRLDSKGWDVVAYNRSKNVYKKLHSENINTVNSIESLVKELNVPRVIWIMVSNNAVSEIYGQLMKYVDEGDVIIDGGNTYYKDTKDRARIATKARIDYMDAGVSGGPDGAKNGACIMIGGNKAIFKKNEELFKDLSVKDGYKYMGESGAGHYVKMVHNGIEYGMMQSIAEGFNLMKYSEYNLDLSDVADIYNHSSVIEGRLINWLYEGYEKYGVELDDISGEVAHSGEGQWTVETAKELGIDVSVIEESLQYRKDSVSHPSYKGKILSLLRTMFGGHNVKNNE